jgi:hypothetical protein
MLLFLFSAVWETTSMDGEKASLVLNDDDDGIGRASGQKQDLHQQIFLLSFLFLPLFFF